MLLFSGSLFCSSTCQHICFRSFAGLSRTLVRSASSATPIYPFPTHRNPTPNEVFHLPRNATEADIKARYFDLVRLYHPDKASDVSPDLAHQRFQVITHSYDVLRGKKSSGSVDLGNANPSVDLRYQTSAAWRTVHRQRSEELYKSGAADEKWKDRLIVVGIVGTVLFVIANTWMTRRRVMQEACNRSQQIALAQSMAQRQQRRAAEEEARLGVAEPTEFEPRGHPQNT